MVLSARIDEGRKITLTELRGGLRLFSHIFELPKGWKGAYTGVIDECPGGGSMWDEEGGYHLINFPSVQDMDLTILDGNQMATTDCIWASAAQAQ